MPSKQKNYDKSQYIKYIHTTVADKIAFFDVLNIKLCRTTSVLFLLFIAPQKPAHNTKWTKNSKRKNQMNNVFHTKIHPKAKKK